MSVPEFQRAYSDLAASPSLGLAARAGPATTPTAHYDCAMNATTPTYVRGLRTLMFAAALLLCTTSARAQQLPVIDMPAIPRGTSMPDAAVAEAMFRTPPPAAGKASAGRAALADGRVVVFAVNKVIPGNPAEATAEQKLGLQQQLAQMAGVIDADGLVSALRKRLRITVAEERL